jgi:wyosine [tRNA(Phe)-imidazoG37] synthetase (radical SAM superfamily)
MQLQTSVVYGPVKSRRLGRSLGVNLAPGRVKACNFNCVYCQYGWTALPGRVPWPEAASVVNAVDTALANDAAVDYITVAGNGEPTLHPAFARIVDGLAAVRARRAPHARLAVLSNGSTLNRTDVVHALMQFDERHMKLDAGDATTLLRMNACPVSLGRLIADLRDMGSIVLQSMFVKDVNKSVDNTTPAAVSAWLDAVQQIRPDAVHVYSLDRKPAMGSLLKVDPTELQGIAARVKALGIEAQVFH